MRRAIIYLSFSLFCFGIFFTCVSYAAGPTKISYSVDSSSIWTKENSPYLVQNHVVVNALLTIEAGTVVKFASSLADLNIKNDFYVNGTREEPVVFTSIHDDSDGNDNDNSTTKPQAGDWSSIMFNPFQDKEFKIKYAKIFYASAGVSFYPSTSQTKDIILKNSEIRKNGMGIYVSDSKATIENNIISENANYGIRVNVSTKIPKAVNNSITNNGIGARGVNSSNPSQTALEAEYNWWGDKTGPQNTNNPGGKGNSVTGQVSFDPWIKEDPIQTPDPVVIIPGIMGSWEVNGEWKIEPMFHIYDNLYEEFADNGYVPEQNLFTFPYEWRDSNKVNAIELKGKIQKIKDQTHRPKVDIVAHSMGGLLAREYVESNYYNNDVDQLITLGTPHLGAPKDYIKWEAGESFFDIFDMAAKRLFTLEALENGFIDVYHYIHNRPIASVQELLPVYNYLYDVENNYTLRASYPNNYPQNGFLETLNGPDKIKSLENVDFTKIIGKLNSNKSVVAGYNVENVSSGELWKHGYPKSFDNPLFVEEGLRKSDGDGTVPLYSAESTQIPADKTIYIQSEHNELLTSAQKDILEILTGKRPTSEVRKWHIPDIWIILVYSPVDIQIQSPSGKKIGKNFETGGEFNEIEGAFYTGYNTDTEFITIPNPENGEYKILTQGTGSGEYKIETTKITEDESDPQGAKESTATITGTTEIGKTEEKIIEVAENGVTYNPDNIPPTITNGAPSGELADAATETQISLATDEKATCRYATEPNIAHDSMAESFVTSDGLSHIATASGLEQWETYHFYARCKDEAGNINPEDFEISFSVPDKTAPTITGYAITEPNANGWYKDDVIVHFTCEDSMSGSIQDFFDITISSEGKGLSADGKCEDKAENGSTLTVSGINIDKNPPEITITSPASQTYLNNQILPIVYEITDNFSANDKITFTTTSCSESICSENFSAQSLDLSLEHLGSYEFKISAADEAGNVSEKSTNFTIKTSLEAIRSNINHYWELNLINTKYEKLYLEYRLAYLKNLFNWLFQFENSNLNPALKKIVTGGIKNIINSYINQLVYHINHATPQLIGQKVADLLVEDLNFIRP